MTLHAQSIAITPGENLTHHEESQGSNQWGVTATASSPIVDAVKGAVQITETAIQTKDERTRELAAATSVLSVYNGYTNAKALAQGTYVSGGVTFGVDNSQSHLAADSTSHDGSSLPAFAAIGATA